MWSSKVGINGYKCIKRTKIVKNMLVSAKFFLYLQPRKIAENKHKYKNNNYLCQQFNN